MQALVDRIGIPLFIQAVIELWNELFLLLMIFSLSSKVKLGKDQVRQPFTVPYTGEIIVFYYAILLYNLFNVLGIVTVGRTAALFEWTARVSVFLYYVTGAFQTLFFVQIVKKHIAEKNGLKKLKTAAFAVQLLHLPLLLLLVTNHFTGLLYSFDRMSIYSRGPLYFLWTAVTVISFLFVFAVYWYHRRSTEPFLRQIICTATGIPVIGILLHAVTDPGVGFNNISVSVTAFIIFIFYEKHRTAAAVQKSQALDRARTALAENRLALEQSKNVVLMAQIQPHFINNYLMSLRARCRQDPELYEYVTNFSLYMRAHFDALGDTKMILFEKEMESIEAYLALESENYGDRLRIEYDIAYDNFLIPAFSVQPLVENAVRHGIATYEKGGTVRISVRAQDQTTCVEIRDIGVGSSNITKRQSERKRIGYNNARARLRSAAAGILTVSSDAHGTTAAISLRSQNVKGV